MLYMDNECIMASKIKPYFRIWKIFGKEGCRLKPERLQAVYSIRINRNLYEEIRIHEVWDQEGRPAHSDRYEEGYLWSELYGQSNAEPFEKWAFNYQMSFRGGSGTLESFFEDHFSQEKVRRKGLIFQYPEDEMTVSQQEYWKRDPRISWLYYKNQFNAVFPVLCDLGNTMLDLELDGRSDDGAEMKFCYVTGKTGTLYAGGKHCTDICFHDERYGRRGETVQLEAGSPEK